MKIIRLLSFLALFAAALTLKVRVEEDSSPTIMYVLYDSTTKVVNDEVHLIPKEFDVGEVLYLKFAIGGVIRDSRIEFQNQGGFWRARLYSPWGVTYFDYGANTVPSDDVSLPILDIWLGSQFQVFFVDGKAVGYGVCGVNANSAWCNNHGVFQCSDWTCVCSESGYFGRPDCKGSFDVTDVAGDVTSTTNKFRLSWTLTNYDSGTPEHDSFLCKIRDRTTGQLVKQQAQTTIDTWTAVNVQFADMDITPSVCAHLFSFCCTRPSFVGPDLRVCYRKIEQGITVSEVVETGTSTIDWDATFNPPNFIFKNGLVRLKLSFTAYDNSGGSDYGSYRIRVYEDPDGANTLVRNIVKEADMYFTTFVTTLPASCQSTYRACIKRTGESKQLCWTLAASNELVVGSKQVSVV